MTDHCYYCERAFAKAFHSEKGLIRTKDHIIPISHGGINNMRNIVYCCTQCNTLKANLTLEQLIHRILALQSKPYRKFGKEYLETVQSNVEKLIFQIAPYREALYKKHKAPSSDVLPKIPKAPFKHKKDPDNGLKHATKEHRDWIKEFQKRYLKEPDPDFHEK